MVEIWLCVLIKIVDMVMSPLRDRIWSHGPPRADLPPAPPPAKDLSVYSVRVRGMGGRKARERGERERERDKRVRALRHARDYTRLYSGM